MFHLFHSPIVNLTNIHQPHHPYSRRYTLAWTVISVWECELTKKNLDATITRIEADLQAAKTKFSIRRENREFVRIQAKKHREILAQVEAELNLPRCLSRYTRKVIDEE